MLKIIILIFDVIVLGMLIMNYMTVKEYAEEQNQMKSEIRKLHYEVCELEDKLRGSKHG